MIFEVECDTTKEEDELTNQTEHTMIAPFIVLDGELCQIVIERDWIFSMIWSSKFSICLSFSIRNTIVDV